MHRSLTFLLSSLALVFAAGCGGSSSSSGGSAATPAAVTSNSPTTTTPAPPPAPTPTPAPVTPPAPAAPTYIVSGWLPYWTYTNADVTIAGNTGNGLDEVNLFGIGLEPDGSLVKRNGIEDPARVAAIRSLSGEVIPTIYDVHDRDALASVLANPAYQARAIQEITALLDQGDYDGIDVDFEHASSSNRDAFSQFVADLGSAIRSRGKIYSVTIPGKRRDLPSWAGYDYAALAASADRVKIMTYGYSGPWSSNPGPIAPTTWITQVLDYAITVMPADKIQLGIPFYGYDWPSDGSTVRSVTYRRAPSLIAQSSAGVTYDATRGEAHFDYTDSNGVDHTVWYSDDRSVRAKAALVKSYGLRGLSIWALGYGDDPLWDAVRAELKTP